MYKASIKSIFIIIVVLLNINILYSQSREELDKRKKDNLKLLEQSKEILISTTRQKTASLNQINLIQKNIETRQGLIENINEEINLLKVSIESNSAEIARIIKRIEVLRKEYAGLIRNSYKVLDKEYALMFLFSSRDINQGYMRYRYLKYISEYRKKLITELDEQKNELIIVNAKLEKNKADNEKLLLERKREMTNLDHDKREKVILVRNLQLREAELRKEIKEREKVMMQIENEIKKLIEEEARKAAGRSGILTEADKLLAAEFGKNQGRLPWPTEKGVITGSFGQQNHPVLKDVKIKSNGIDISSSSGAVVRSVFDGQVSKVIAIMGANYTVIIKHGDYYTVYQNLVDVRVKSGDNIKTGEIIGNIFSDKDDISKIHFEIWKERKILNPELWLRKI